MSAEDDFDQDPAPLPPYDRSWRHPAEHAEHLREEYEVIAAPPPLGRRILALSASVGVVATVAVLSVAVPKGISDYAEIAADSNVPTSPTQAQVRVKNLAATNVLVVTSARGEASAIPVGNGYLLTSIEDVGGNDSIRVTLASGVDVGASITDEDRGTGIAFVRIGATQRKDIGRILGPIIPSSDATMGELDGLFVVDHIGSQSVELNDGVMTSSVAGLRPVVTARPIDGVAAVVDRNGTIVAIAVRRAHATWLVPGDRVAQILSSVLSD